jgi:hypothetical protein
LSSAPELRENLVPANTFNRLILALIIAVATFLRFWRLGTVSPPTADEVLASVDLHAVITTGRHYTGGRVGLLGQLIPILDGRREVSVIGTQVTDLRLVPAAFGVMTVVCVYVLAKELFDERVALFSAAALAVMPWDIYLSRVFFPASETTFATLLSAYLLLVALRQRSLAAGVGTAIAAALSIYTYPAAIVLTPLILLAVLLHRPILVKRYGTFLASSVLGAFVLLMVPYVVQHLDPTDPSVALANSVTGQKLLWDQGFTATSDLRRFALNWLSYFRPNFWLLHGDPNVRSSIQVLGQVGWILGVLGCLGFFLTGFRPLIRRRTLILWTIFFPIADAVTYYNAQSNSVRGSFGYVVWALWAGLGADSLLRLARDSSALRRISLSALGLGVIVQTVFFGTTYFGSYPTKYGYAFETGYAQVGGILRSRGVQNVPITFHGGYERGPILNYFNDYHLSIAQTLLSCYDLPPDVVKYTVLPRVFVIREDRDFDAIPGCIRDNIQRDVRSLRSVPNDHVQVLADYPNSPSGPWRTAILFVTARNQISRSSRPSS